MANKFKLLLESYKKILKKLTEYNTDYFILFLGFRGTGKSTTALYIAQKLSEETGKKAYLVLEPDELNFEKGSIVVIDELIRFAFLREHMTKYSREFIKMLNLIRPLNLFVIAIIPKLSLLDKALRTYDFFKEVYVFYERGRALWFGPPEFINDQSSCVYLFQKWDRFSEMYEYLNRKTLRKFLKFYKGSLLKIDLEDFDTKKKFIWYKGKQISYEDYVRIREEMIKELKLEDKKGLSKVEQKIYEVLDNLPIGNYELIGRTKCTLYDDYGKVVFESNLNIAVWLHVLKIMQKENKLRFVRIYDKEHKTDVVYITKVESKRDYISKFEKSKNLELF